MALTIDHEFASPLRRRILAILIGITFLGFIARFVQLQVLEGEELRGAAAAQGIKRIERIPVRGAIYDRKARVVVASVPSYNVTITPQDFEAYRDETLPLLAKILDVDTTFIVLKLRQAAFYSKFQPVKIWNDADARIIAAIEESGEDLPGVDISYESKRHYEAPVRASHLLGFTKEISEPALAAARKTADSLYYHPGDVVGTAGLEKYRENVLRGVKGFEFVAVDRRGQRQARFNEGMSDINSIDGSGIQLGMDIDLQLYAEQLMSEHHGAIVALDPRNGEILALVSKPDFDLDIFSGRTSKEEYQSVMLDKSNPLFNRALQTKYPPGSTWKMMMLAAALQSKTIGFNYTFNCPGSFTYGDHTYMDHFHGAGVTNARSITVSCNAFYNKMALMIGIDTMYRYARLFGFDSVTGVDIGHEGRGSIPNTAKMNKWYPRGWTKGYTVSHGIGQGEVSVTPIQQAAYAAVFANKGTWIQPHAARRIYNVKTGTWDSVQYQSRKLPIGDSIFAVIRRGMYGAVNEPGGTAHAAKIPDSDILVAGKTGTAQNPHGEDHAWFVCFAPFDKPTIAMCVMVENAGFGGVVSAPIARKLLRLYLTGVREDSVPSVLPNTEAYRKLKDQKYNRSGNRTPSLPKERKDTSRRTAEAIIPGRRAQ
jgi:penicillin-binding protein 2